MKKVVIILLSCTIFVGIVYGLKMLSVPHLPELVVNSPVDGFVADKYSLEITGKVSHDCVVKAVVIRNNKEISVAFAKPSPSSGEYQTILHLIDSARPDELLENGTYTIKVSALNVAKKVTVVERYIVLSSPPPIEKEAEEETREQAELEAQAQAQAKAQAELDAQRQAAEDARKQAEIAAAQERAKAAQQAKLDAQKRAKAQAELDAQRQMAEDARKQAKITTAQERAKAAQQAKLDAQKWAEAQAKLDAQKQAAENAQKQAEIAAAQERAKAAQQAKIDEQKRAEAQAKLDAQRQATENARKQAEIAAQERAKIDAQKEAEAQAAKEQEAKKQAAVPNPEPKPEPKIEGSAFKTGLELRQSGKTKEAIDAFSKVESDDSDYQKALWNISIMSLSVDQSNRTLKGIEEISRSSGETAFTCFYRGVAHYKMARKRASSENADEAIPIYQQAIRDLDNAYIKRQDFSRIKILQVPFNSPQKNVHDIRYYKAMCYYLIYKWDRTQGELEDAGLQKVKMQAKDAFDDYFRYFSNLPEEEKQSCTALYNNALQVNKEL